MKKDFTGSTDDFRNGKALTFDHYDRSQLKTGIVHIGPGAFFRGHIATYVEDLARAGDLDWGITGISLRSGETRDKLATQDYLYTVTAQSVDGNTTDTVGCLQNIIVAKEAPQDAINALTNPDVKIVTLTVTQSGYYIDQNTKQLDFSHPDIVNSLGEGQDTTTAIGLIVAALDARRQAGLPAFTVMSCDNLPGNGHVIANAVLAYAAQKSRELREWISKNVSFPNTMVDRIVPRYDRGHSEELYARTGLCDDAPIYTEPFKQWVIEKTDNLGLPDFPSVGATLADDVYPFELMKIRLLNGAHMALGIVGRLSGYEYDCEAMADADVQTFVRGFMAESAQTLPAIEGIDFDEYQEAIAQRLIDSSQQDELARLARTGSQKVTSRFIEPLQEAVSKDMDTRHLAFSIAGWFYYLKCKDVNGEPMDIFDPEAARTGLMEVAKRSNGDPRPLMGIGANGQSLFGHSLVYSKSFVAAVESYLHDICEGGMKSALEKFVGNEGVLDLGLFPDEEGKGSPPPPAA
ncbi:MAG: mannitol dehydrogenase family protein [Pseudobdellovibrionaceae bacterium]